MREELCCTTCHCDRARGLGADPATEKEDDLLDKAWAWSSPRACRARRGEGGRVTIEIPKYPLNQVSRPSDEVDRHARDRHRPR